MTNAPQQALRIRTILWVFLLDTAFVVFHNAPPRMVTREMRMHFAPSEAAFHAETVVACYSYPSSDPAHEPLIVSPLIQKMCKSPLTPEIRTRVASLSVLNLFVLTSGEYSVNERSDMIADFYKTSHAMTFQIRQSFGNPVNRSTTWV